MTCARYAAIVVELRAMPGAVESAQRTVTVAVPAGSDSNTVAIGVNL